MKKLLFISVSALLLCSSCVTEKNGKVYVAMSDKLLFESGSAKVDKRGKEALAKLAEVLNKQNDIDVFIERHTSGGFAPARPAPTTGEATDRLGRILFP